MIAPALHSETYSAFFLMLRSHGSFAEDLEPLLFSSLTSIAYKKDDYLLRIGQIASKIWFLYSGYVRWFKEAEKGQETVWLSIPGNIIQVPFSFQHRVPSEYFLQALTPCKTLGLDYDNVIRICNEQPVFTVMLNNLTDEHTAERQQYAEVMRLHKGADRMKYLEHKIGSNIYSLDASILSSFINLSESSFYKLRKRIGHNSDVAEQ